MKLPKTNKTKMGQKLKAGAWFVEWVWRTFVGWMLLSNFDHFVAIAAGYYALVTAFAIVVYHFYGAHVSK